MPLDARFCPYCGKEQCGYSTFYPIAPGDPFYFTFVPGASEMIVPLAPSQIFKAIGHDTT